eukprot:768811-Hanusia_phi.AAC.5
MGPWARISPGQLSVLFAPAGGRWQEVNLMDFKRSVLRSEATRGVLSGLAGGQVAVVSRGPFNPFTPTTPFSLSHHKARFRPEVEGCNAPCNGAEGRTRAGGRGGRDHIL